MFGIAFVLGLGIVYLRGIPILIIGIIGGLGGLFYTARPIGYKYVALGDLFVFLFMGVFLVCGSYFALTGIFNIQILWISLPISLLVTAILHGNNVRDIQHDKEAGIKTMAIHLGHRISCLYYSARVIGAYILVGLMIAKGILSYWSLLVVLSLPITFKNIRTINRSGPSKPEGIAAMTAQLHLLFGVLLIISIIIRAIIK